MAASFVAAGTPQEDNTLASITVPWPTHQVGDVALLLVECTGGQAASLTTANGFTELANSPSATGVTTAGTRIHAFICTATTTSMASPVVAVGAQHGYGVILTFRGVTASGVNTVAQQKAAASTSVNVTAITPKPNENDAVIVCVSRDNDAAGAAFSAWSNSTINGGMTEVFDDGTALGNGGGIGVAWGPMGSGAVLNATTATVTSSINAYFTIVLVPSGGAAVSKTATDAVGFSDAATRSFAGARTAADARGQADTPIRVVVLARTAADALGQADVAIRALAESRSTTDALAAAEASTQLRTTDRTATDARGQSDVATRAMILARSVADARGQAEVATRLATLLRSVADARGQSDAVTASRLFSRTAADARGQSDVATRAMILARTAADARGQSDVATRIELLQRSVADSLAVADVATRVSTQPRTAADSLAAADVAVRAMILARTIAQALGFADVATRQSNRPRSTADSLTISDAAVAAAFRALRRLKLITYHALVYSPDANGGPGTPKLELDPDLLNLVWQQNQNLAGQAAFALTRKSTKIDQIEWMVDHIKVFRESSSGVRTMFAGKLVKPIYSAVDILCYAWDYLAFLQLSISGYKTLYPTKKIGSEVVSPEWVLAKGVSNSPFTFVTTGTIQDPLGLDGTTFIKTNATFGVTLFDRLFIFYTLAEMAMANTTNNVKFEITREAPHTFNFWKNYGAAKVDYAGVFPGNLMDYDFDAGKEHERLDLFTVLSDGLGGQVSYEVATSDVATSTLRRLQAAVPIRTLFGVSSGTTETDQAKAALARQLIVSTRYPRAVRVRPRQGEIDLFNGHDLGDTFRHTFQKADRSGDQYDGYLRLVGVAGSWAAQHGEMIDLYLRGAS